MLRLSVAHDPSLCVEGLPAALRARGLVVAGGEPSDGGPPDGGPPDGGHPDGEADPRSTTLLVTVASDQASDQPSGHATSGPAPVGHGASEHPPVARLADALSAIAYTTGVVSVTATVAPPAPGPAPADDPLSPRERQVIDRIAQGLTHAQIALRLGISPHTVDTYIRRIRSKLQLGNKAELARAAVLGAPVVGPAPLRGTGRPESWSSRPDGRVGDSGEPAGVSARRGSG